MKEFVFLYPIPEIIDYEINISPEQDKEEFRREYKTILNRCIDFRYRQKGFGINYAVPSGSYVSDVITLQNSDRIIEIGAAEYSKEDFILNQLNGAGIIRIGGFHMWDCVDRLARRSYERKLDTLVDEDLTELFISRMEEPEFRVDTYPTFNPREFRKEMFDIFMKSRKDKPWFWQDY